MRKTKLFFALVSFMLCVCANAEIIKSGSCGGNVTYTLDDSGLLVIEGSGEMTNYYNHNGVPWYSQRFNVKQVEIKNGVTSIGEWAFADCSSLASITIPNSVTNIGIYAFSGCSGLTSITIPNSVTYIVPGVFNGCSGLTSITIPNSVTYIESGAFSGCSGLTSITIPNSVTYVGFLAFEGCSNLTSMSVESGNTKYDSRNSCNAIIHTETNILIAGCCNTIIPNSVTSIGYYAFAYCSSLASITIPNSVKSIENCAFFVCSGLTSITIPNSVKSIGQQAFAYCSGLTSITIPNSVTSIEMSAFEGCSSLTSITIPNSVTGIGGGAFSGCSGLTSVNVESGNTKYDSRDNCNAIIETKTNTLIAGCYNTIIPNSVTSIGNCAFDGCTGLASVTIPNSVTSIGLRAFEDCSGLTSITIPNSVTSIGDCAFSDCNNLSTFYCNATTPPTASYSSFYGMNYDSTILYVPKGTKNNYASSEGWKKFLNIVEMEDGGDDEQEYLVITKKDGEVIKIPMEEIESITPKQAEPGDIDGNGEVNVADLTKLIDMLLKK